MEENKSVNEEDIQAERVQRSGRQFLANLWEFIKNTLSLREGIDKPGTMEGIKADVEFKGHAAWILVCSIMIASIGLSIGNIPIIVGAMLISPLMGPILGIGLAAGTNDYELLKKSLKNFGVAVAISIIISWLYFLIIPQPEINLELQGRKEATLLAIAVAFFGGAAGIIAGSRTLKSNVVPGVAIATALMPPLCTVGFGLATFNWSYVTGALYLFGINCVFIALPTYLYIRYMRFPVKEFVDPIRERKIKRIIYFFIVLIMIPSAYIFYNVLQRSFFQSDANEFLTELEMSLDQNTNTTIIERKIMYDQDPPVIKIALMGDPISDETLAAWETLKNKHNLQDCMLDIKVPKDYSHELNELREMTAERGLEQNRLLYQSIIDEKNKEVEMLQQQLMKREQADINIDDVLQQVSLLTLDVEDVKFAKVYEKNDAGLDTIPTFFITWKSGVSKAKREDDAQLIERWFKSKLKDPRVTTREEK
ncbi:MAG: DUF389 domain-containing protein [Flavobacteriales bacterium]|nr:DUF389 domain-containing protein [Flavobacteriales bacterium]